MSESMNCPECAKKQLKYNQLKILVEGFLDIYITWNPPHLRTEKLKEIAKEIGRSDYFEGKEPKIQEVSQ